MVLITTPHHADMCSILEGALWLPCIICSYTQLAAVQLDLLVIFNSRKILRKFKLAIWLGRKSSDPEEGWGQTGKRS